jgi:hypothetical protein
MAGEPSIHASWTAGTIGVLPSPGRLIPRDTNWGRTRRTYAFVPPPDRSDSGAAAPGAGRAAAERTRRRMRRPVSLAVTCILIAASICPRDVPAGRRVGIVH